MNSVNMNMRVARTFDSLRMFSALTCYEQKNEDGQR